MKSKKLTVDMRKQFASDTKDYIRRIVMKGEQRHYLITGLFYGTLIGFTVGFILFEVILK